jgi:hypothetical protein
VQVDANKWALELVADSLHTYGLVVLWQHLERAVFVGVERGLHLASQ